MKVLLTRELGRLAKWLRILGIDAGYFSEENTSSLIIQALKDDRIILTRNHRIPQARGMKVVLINSERIKEQIAEALGALEIKPDLKMMFTRCVICNEELVYIEKEKIRERVPEYVFNTQKDFINCPKCNRIYWQGTHWGSVTKTLEGIIG
ncbi:MAG: Mut7-C RNAse domain-containing protein [Candidatus Omnitrophica bacterium]|nr:Mut7-C RNAse domain-containing protein [Candidatus Omnitrophota bacterium]